MKKHSRNQLTKWILTGLAVSAISTPMALASDLTNYPGNAKIEKHTSELTDIPDLISEEYKGKIVKVDNRKKTITYTFKKGKTVKLGDGNFVFEGSESKEHGKYKTIINAEDILVDNEGGFKVPEGVNLEINGNMHINGTSEMNRAVFPSGLGFIVGNGEGQRARILINGTLDTTKIGTKDGFGLLDPIDRGLLGDKIGYTGARWLPNGIYGRASHGSLIDVKNVDIRVHGVGVTSDPYYSGKDKNISDYDLMTINVLGGKIITPSINDELFKSKPLPYYALGNFGGTININAYSTANRPLILQKNDVNMVGNVITIKDSNLEKPGLPDKYKGNPFFYRSGRTNINLNTPKSTWDGTIDNAGRDMAGEINLFLSNGAVWNNQNMSVLNGLDAAHMPTPSVYKYGNYDGKAYLNDLIGSDTKEKTGFIKMNDAAPLIINKVAGYSKFIYDHDNTGVEAKDYKAGDVIIKTAKPQANITLATPNKNIDTNNQKMVDKVLNTLAGKASYLNAGKDNNLVGSVEIADGLTASSVAANLTTPIIFDASNNGKGKTEAKTTPDKPETPTTPEVTNPTKDQEATKPSTGTGNPTGETTTKPDTQTKPGKEETKPGKGESTVTPEPAPSTTTPTDDKKPVKPSTGTGSSTGETTTKPDTQTKPEAGGSKVETSTTTTSEGGVDKYDQQIINDNYVKKEQEKFWQNKGVLSNKVYTFHKDTELATKYNDKITGAQKKEWVFGQIMWAGYDPGKIDMTGHKLTLHPSISDDVNMKPAGILIDSETLTIDNAGGIDIISDNPTGSAKGIEVIGNNSRGQWFNGEGNSKLIINNDLKPEHAVKIRTIAGGTLTDGILVSRNSGTAEVDIKGLVDVNVSNNEAQGAWNYGGKLSLGGGKITNAEGLALRTNDGETNFNAKQIGDEVKIVNENTPVNITGNIRYDNNSTVNVGLATADSSIEGMIGREKDNKQGNMTLIMKNGATWNNVSSKIEKEDYDSSVVTHLISDKGLIKQNTDKPIELKKLSGDVTVVYQHTNNGENKKDFAGGNVTVDSADQGSVIKIVTDNANIDTQDAKKYSKVLDNMAHKLTYTGWKDGEYNLQGKVQIASGLTSSSLVLDKPITFSDSTGAGYYTDKVRPDQDKDQFTTTITGDKEANKQYVDQGVLYENGNYTFRQDSTIEPETNKPAIAPESKIEVNAVNKKLNINVKNATEDVAGVELNNEGSSASIRTGELNINVQGNKAVAGIKAAVGNMEEDPSLNISGTTNINVNGQEKAYGVLVEGNNHVVFNDALNIGTATKAGVVSAKTGIEDAVGIAVQGGEDDMPNLDLNGAVKINSQTTGILANNGSAQLTTNGDLEIKVAEAATPTYAVVGKNGTISINSNENADQNVVDIEGNIANLADEDGFASINLGLKNNKSKLVGAIYDGSSTADGIYLDLANGATWENKVFGKIDDNYQGGIIGTLTGGKKLDDAGFIHMMDDKDLVVKSLAGSINFIYNHEGDGSSKENYKAGDVRIKKVATDPGKSPMAIVSTDNAGIDTNNRELVGKVLNALANKIYNEDTKDGNRLYAEARISSGLTSSSETLKKGRISFKENHQGEYQAPEEGLEASLPVIYTGNNRNDFDSTNYYKDKNILDVEGNYLFDQDFVMTTTKDSKAVGAGWGKTTGGIIINAARGKARDITLDFNGHDVDITSSDDSKGASAYGNSATPIFVKSDNQKIVLKNIDNLDLSVDTSVGDSLIGRGIGVINTDLVFDNVKNTNMNVNSNRNRSSAAISVSDGSFTNNNAMDITVNSITPVFYVNGVDPKKKTEINVAGGKFTTKGAKLVNGAGTAVVNINKDKTHKVDAKGNIDFTSPNKVEVNMNLSGYDSKWTGASLGVNNESTDEHGIINLGLNKKATWTTEVFTDPKTVVAGGGRNRGRRALDSADNNVKAQFVETLKGGQDETDTGYIVRTDSGDLTINKLDGYTTVVYGHSNSGQANEDYTAGDTIINSAAKGSGVNVITDSANVKLDSEEDVTKTLKALANKILYKAYLNNEKNIKAKAMIASGLTNSSTTLVSRHMDFDANTSRGILATDETVNTLPIITGTDKDKDKYTVKDGVYTLPEEANIVVENGDSPIYGEQPITIDAPETVLNLDNRGRFDKDTYGIQSTTGNKIDIKVKELNITTRNANHRAEAIHLKNADANVANIVNITGNVNVNVHGTDYALGTYSSGNSVLTINGNYTAKGNEDNPSGVTNEVPFYGNDDYYGNSALYSGADYNIQKGAKTVVNGDVDIAIMNGAGIVANGGGSEVDINGGGTIKMDVKPNTKSHTYALVAQSGHITMNMDGDNAGTKDVNITGNIGILRGSVNPSESDKSTTIKLGLGTPNSKLIGAVDNDFKPEDRTNKYTTDLTLAIQNGATWENKYLAPVHASDSKVENLIGGKDKAHRGVIKQSSPDKILIGNYKGNTQVIYDHEVKKNKLTITGGNVEIAKAAPESYMLLTTDNNGINMQDDADVRQALNKLAGKLVYGSSKSDKNLKGQVGIASGLTASNETMPLADISFDNNNTGTLADSAKVESTDIPAAEAAKPNTPGTTSGTVTRGDYENPIMNGVRSATTAVANSWRDVNNLAINHLGEMAREDGVYAWGNILTGKEDVKNNGAAADTKYHGIQAGYDVVKNGKASGVQVIYRKENTDFANGSGHDKALAVSAYAKNNLNKNRYFGVMGSFGRVDADYEVANEISTAIVDGKYKANGTGLGLVYGQEFAHKDVKVTPEFSLMATHLAGDNYKAMAKDGRILDVDQKGIDSLVGKFTTRFEKTNGRGSVFGKIGLAHEFAGNISGDYNSKDGGLKHTSFSGKDTWIETAIGAKYDFANGFSSRFQVSKNFAGHNSNSWNANLNLQFLF